MNQASGSVPFASLPVAALEAQVRALMLKYAAPKDQRMLMAPGIMYDG
jgi:hypothetical protein